MGIVGSWVPGHRRQVGSERAMSATTRKNRLGRRHVTLCHVKAVTCDVTCRCAGCDTWRQLRYKLANLSPGRFNVAINLRRNFKFRPPPPVVWKGTWPVRIMIMVTRYALVVLHSYHIIVNWAPWSSASCLLGFKGGVRSLLHSCLLEQ